MKNIFCHVKLRISREHFLQIPEPATIHHAKPEQGQSVHRSEAIDKIREHTNDRQTGNRTNRQLDKQAVRQTDN